MAKKSTPDAASTQDPTIASLGYEDAVVLAIGGKDGYVGRDGAPPEGEARPPGPIDD